MTRKYASCVTWEGKKPWNLKHGTIWNIAVRVRGTTHFIYAWFNTWRIRFYNELSFTRLFCSTKTERDHFSIRSRNQKWPPVFEYLIDIAEIVLFLFAPGSSVGSGILHCGCQLLSNSRVPRYGSDITYLDMSPISTIWYTERREKRLLTGTKHRERRRGCFNCSRRDAIAR